MTALTEMPQFRATIDSDSPAQAAKKLGDAGLTPLGPWAAQSDRATTPLGLTEELEVTILMEATSSEEAEERVREVLGERATMRFIEVLPTPDGDDSEI
jgi:hypothetical protein